MRKQCLFSMVVFIAAAVLCRTWGETGIDSTFIQINNKGSTAWYDLQKASYLNDFNGYDFGSFTSGDTFLISGSEANTFKNTGGDVTGTYLYYRIYLQGAGAPGFSSAFAGWTANAPYQDASGNTYSAGGDQKWAQIASTPNILSGLAQSGTYVVEVYTMATSNEGDRYASNGGSNYKATFEYTADEPSSVPEPAAMGLFVVGFGLVFLARQRRLHA